MLFLHENICKTTNFFRKMSHEINSLIGIGFSIQLIAGPRNETMLTIIERLSKLPPANLTFLEPFLPQPAETVATLQTILPTLPTENTSAIRAAKTAVMLGVTIIVVSLRFYARRFLTKQLRAEDWACLAALFSVSAVGISFIVGRLNS